MIGQGTTREMKSPREMRQVKPSASFADSKPHYNILDGLRGVAALLVVWYHVHEGLSFAQGGSVITGINHGYLAVDFFFILSGFVIGYAYDDRMGRTLTLGGFFRRRLIRLHPMAAMGAAVGAAAFCLQGCVRWDGTRVSVSAVMLAMLAGMFFIPALPGAGREVRGNGEMFPLNGPSWSLFFEYIGNIVYALLICRMGKRALAALTAALGLLYGWFATADVSGCGNMGVGWTLDGINFFGGLLRMMFPYAAGMLLARVFRPRRIRGAFWICSAALAAVFTVPYIEPAGAVCLNGVFEFACVAVLFPLLVSAGASGCAMGGLSAKVCNFLGDISYPLYITHYPFMYLFYAWLIRTRQYTLAEVWLAAAAVFAWNVLFAWMCLRFYDLPVRKFLATRFLYRKQG